MEADEYALFSREVLAYILENEHLNPFALSLKKSPFPEIPMSIIAKQILGRQVAKKKFPFLLEVQQYRYPIKESLEQASSEETAQYKSRILKGQFFVDLSGGMGIDTYFLGNKFKSSTYIEPNKKLFTTTSQNFKYLGFNQCSTLNETVESFLDSNKRKFDWAYIDPSRRISGTRKTSIHNYEPNIVELQQKIKNVSDNILVKLSPMQDISECVTALAEVHQIWVLSVQNEVKELIIHIKKEAQTTPIISAVDITNGQESEFTHNFNGHQCQIGYAEAKKYIYQPSAALVKAQLNNIYAKGQMLDKLNPNTQLYTSETLKPDFFGRIFRVQQKIQLTKKTLKKILPAMKVNILSKNFPLSSQELKRKYNLKDGGDDYIIAYTDFEKKRVAVFCERIK